MQKNQDMRTAWFLAVVPAFVALAALIVTFATPADASARWAWCLGDPKYTLTTPDGQTGEIWVDVYFPVEELDNVAAVDVTITVPANIAATVDPDSLGVFVNGELIQGIAVTGAVSHSGAEWSSGPVKVDVEAILHAEGDFPVKVNITRSNGSGLADGWVNGRANELIAKPGVPVKVN